MSFDLQRGKMGDIVGEWDSCEVEMEFFLFLFVDSFQLNAECQKSMDDKERLF